MGDVRARLMEYKDVKDAKQVIRRAHLGDAVFAARAETLQARIGRAWVVEDGSGSAVAVATVTRTRFHNHDFLTVDSACERPREVLPVVLEACRLVTERPLFSRLRPHDSVWVDAYSNWGFQLVETAFQSTVNPSFSRNRKWAESVGRRLPGQSSIVGLAPDLLNDAVELLATWYRRVHTWSPPNPISAAEAKAAFISNALPQSLGIVAEDGRLDAVGVVSADPFSTDSGVGHVEFVACHPGGDESLLVEAVYAALCLRSAEVLKALRLTSSDIYPPSIRAASNTPFRFEPELVIVAEPHVGR